MGSIISISSLCERVYTGSMGEVLRGVSNKLRREVKESRFRDSFFVRLEEETREESSKVFVFERERPRQ